MRRFFLLALALCFAGGLSAQINNGGSGTAGGTTTITQNRINLTDYGVKTDGNACYAASVGTTNGNGIITCSDAPFTAADVGKTIFATNGCCGFTQYSTSVKVLGESTITGFTSTTQVTASNNSTFTCSANITCLVIWGSMNDTAFTAAEVAGAAIKNGCPSYYFPGGGFMLFNGKHFNNSAIPAQCSAGTQLGGAISSSVLFAGQGLQSTILVPTPNFDSAASSSGSACGSSGCLFSGYQMQARDMTFWGGGCGDCGTANSKYVVPGFGGPQFRNVTFAGFGTVKSGTVGVVGAQLAGINLVVDGWGNLGMDVTVNGTGVTTVCYICFFGDGGSGGLVQIESGSKFIDFETIYGGGTGNMIVPLTGSVYESHGSSVQYATTALAVGLDMTQAGATAYIYGSNFTNSCVNCVGAAIQTGATTAKMYASGATFGGGSGTGKGLVVNDGTFVDLGGNSFNNGTTIVAGHWYNSESITGTTQTTGNVALTSGWSTSTVTAASGNSQREQFTITAAGTPSASPVVTVTFPTGFLIGPICTITQDAGTFGILTNPSVAAPSTTAVAITFAGTPVATQTYTFVLDCRN